MEGPNTPGGMATPLDRCSAVFVFTPRAASDTIEARFTSYFSKTAFPAETNAPCEDGESAVTRRGKVAGGVETWAVSLVAGRRDEPMTVERRRHDSG